MLAPLSLPTETSGFAPRGVVPKPAVVPRWCPSIVSVAFLALATPSTALAFATYTAELVWDRNPEAARYDVYVRFVQGAGGPPKETERKVSFQASAAPASFDGKIHVALPDIPVGPTAIFSVTVRKDGFESPRSNEIQLTYATVARYVDSDGDGLLDYEEDLNLDLILDPGETDPNNPDTDGDGLSDYDELYRTFTNPRAQDSDGDGIIDSKDTCNDIDRDGFGFAGSGTPSCKHDNCPFHYNPTQLDSDYDGMGDACDPCTNVGGLQSFDPRGVGLTFRNVIRDNVRGNDVLKFRGEFELPPGLAFGTLDPTTTGARILITSLTGKPIVDAQLPSGAFRATGSPRGWQTDNRRRTYKYKDKTNTRIHGLSKAVVKNVGAKSSSGTVRVAVKGFDGDYPVSVDSIPLNVSVVLGDGGAAQNGACGESDFGPDSCHARSVRSTLVCR